MNGEMFTADDKPDLRAFPDSKGIHNLGLWASDWLTHLMTSSRRGSRMIVHCCYVRKSIDTPEAEYKESSNSLTVLACLYQTRTMAQNILITGAGGYV